VGGRARRPRQPAARAADAAAVKKGTVFSVFSAQGVCPANWLGVCKHSLALQGLNLGSRCL
jgi:hypothetical protein